MAEQTTDDLTTVDGIITALYDSISGPAERKRDLVRFRSLFIEGARLIPVRPQPGGGAVAEVLDVDDFFRIASENFKVAGFFEREIARRSETFGCVTHVFSTYEARHAEEDGEPFARGINSIQLLNDGERWWVVTIFWDSERPGNPIPKQYLPH